MFFTISCLLLPFHFSPPAFRPSLPNEKPLAVFLYISAHFLRVLHREYPWPKSEVTFSIDLLYGIGRREGGDLSLDSTSFGKPFILYLASSIEKIAKLMSTPSLCEIFNFADFAELKI